MDEKLKRQIVGGAVLLIALVIVINWLGNGAAVDSEVAGQLAQNRETRVYDLSQLDTEGPLAAPAEEAADDRAPAPANDDTAAEGLPPAATPEPEPARPAPPSAAKAPPAEPVLAPPEPSTATAPAKPAAKPAPAVNGNWIVQVGSYSSEPNAQALKTKLQQQGYATELAAVTLDGRPMYRLRVGPYGNEDAARAAAETLEDTLRQKVSVMRR